jgi:hypothetical protein
MPEQDHRAGDMKERHVVLRLPFPAHHEPAVVVKPREESLDLSPPLATAEGPAILGRRAPAVRSVLRNQLDAPLGHQDRVQGVAVVGLVPDESVREVREEAVVERGPSTVSPSAGPKARRSARRARLARADRGRPHDSPAPELARARPIDRR